MTFFAHGSVSCVEDTQSTFTETHLLAGFNQGSKSLKIFEN